jgi:hydrogenase maturation protease
MAQRTLVIGYGNPSRNDDGVGLAVVNRLRERCGRPPLDESGDGFDDLGNDLDTLFLQQLTPELAETVGGYERLVLVDAHVGTVPELVRQAELVPASAPAMVSHILRPEHLLALAKLTCGRAPRATLYSVRGFDFNFGEQLSPLTAQGVEQVARQIWAESQSAL